MDKLVEIAATAPLTSQRRCTSTAVSHGYVDATSSLAADAVAIDYHDDDSDLTDCTSKHRQTYRPTAHILTVAGFIMVYHF